MPSRVLRDGINTSERVDGLSDPAEIFYRRLMSAVDDWGRYYAKPELLIAELYPLRIGTPRCPSCEQIVAYLAECERVGLVLVYEGGGCKRYVQMLDFRQQHRSPSKFPAPPLTDDNECAQPLASVNIREQPLASVSIRSPSRSRSRISKSSLRARAREAPAGTAPGQASTRREHAARLLRDSGVKIKPENPALGRWLEAGATDAQLAAAVERAREYKPPPAEISAAYLDPIVGQVLEPPPKSPNGQTRNMGASWSKSDTGIERKGRELGMTARSGESYEEYANRIFERLRANGHA